jgi:hypothetical protein
MNYLILTPCVNSLYMGISWKHLMVFFFAIIIKENIHMGKLRSLIIEET